MELSFSPILNVTFRTSCYFGKKLNTMDFIRKTWYFEVCALIIKEAKSVDKI